MRNAPIELLLVGLVLVAGAYALAFTGGHPLAPWGLALGATNILAAMLWLGARRNGALPRTLGITMSVAALATAIGFGIALSLPAPAADSALLLGLPRVTALMLIFVGAVPLVVLPIGYALAFDREVMPK